MAGNSIATMTPTVHTSEDLKALLQSLPAGAR